MADLKELTNIIIAHYDNLVACGKTKMVEDCNYPCVPLAQIQKYLKSIGIDWRNDYNYKELTDLIHSLDGVSLHFNGVPYIYTQKTKLERTANTISPASNTKKTIKTNANGEPKAHEVRNAYRKLAKSAGDWVSIDKLMKEVGWTRKQKDLTSKYKLQFNSLTNCVRVHNISRYEMIDDIYFEHEKNSFPSNVAKLREMALDENWDEHNKVNKLLDNYLCYTYARVKDEKKISKSKDELHACWNTGLVDFRYLSIYCYMTRKDTNSRWMFKAFCIDGEDLGKEMGRNISVMPEPAMYFDEDNLLCQPKENISVDYDHIIREHPSRLPLSWLKQVLGEKAEWNQGETSDKYDKRVGDLLPKRSKVNSNLQSFLEDAIDKSVKRCQWNYKTAIPYYDPNNKIMGWFLPLCEKVSQTINGKEKTTLKPFAALVVTKGNSGRFQGETIYRLSWAYRCARLVCRPDSDWLTPLFATDDKLDSEE